MSKKKLTERKKKASTAQDDHDEFKPKDIKNIVKNTVKLFQTWVA